MTKTIDYATFAIKIEGMMVDKYFWRRGFAWVVDLAVVAMVITILGLLIQPMFQTELVPPGIINSKNCVSSSRFTEERLQQLLPLPEDGSHFQLDCSHTHMLVSRYRSFTYGYIVQKGNSKSVVSVNYAVDENGNKIDIFPMDIILYLLFPFLMAVMIARFQSTIGKRMLRLQLMTKNLQKPTLKNSLIREHIKHAPFIIFGIYGVSQMERFSHMSDEALSRVALELRESMLAGTNIFLLIGTGLLISIALFWFFFGSFIRWKGQTYWDQVAGMMVATPQDFRNLSV